MTFYYFGQITNEKRTREVLDAYPKTDGVQNDIEETAHAVRNYGGPKKEQAKG